MKYQKLGNSDIQVSTIAFGAWGLGGGNVWSDMSINVKQVEELLDCASDLGINYIDTAPVYGVGVSETILGKALKGRRDRFIVQTKCCMNWRNKGGEFVYERDGKIVNKDHRASAIKKDIEESLLRMDLDYIDSMVVHRMSETVPVEETVGALNEMIQEGKIRTIVISNSKPSDLEMYQKYGNVSAVQEKFSLIDDKNRIYFDTCKKYNTTFQVYGSLEEGILTGRSYLEKQFSKGDVRESHGLLEAKNKEKLMRLYDVLEPLAEKYQCSIANLIQAWTLKQYDKISLLTGFRRTSTMENTCKVFDIVLSDTDEKIMRENARKCMEEI